MAFESLAGKLEAAFKKLRGKGRLTESDIKVAMREVKMALLEADVNFKIVKDFIKNVSERAVGADVLESLTPGQQVIKIVNEDSENTIDGTVEIRTFLGKAYQYDVKTSIGNLIVNSENSVVYEKGNKVKLQLPSNKIVIL